MYKIQLSLIALFSMLLLTKINLTMSDNEIASSKNVISVTTEQVPSNFDVSKFYKRQCGYCHSKEELIGPDMNKIKQTYKKKYPGKATFIKAISAFVANPDKKNAIYKDGIDNFMDMPKMAYKPEQVKAVVEYIFNNKYFK